MKKKTHTLVTIEDFYKAPRRYTKHYCTDHPDIELSGACQQCMKVFCIYDIPGKCDAGTGEFKILKGDVVNYFLRILNKCKCRNEMNIALWYRLIANVASSVGV